MVPVGRLRLTTGRIYRLAGGAIAGVFLYELAPDVNARQLEVTVTMPISFHRGFQRIQLGAPQVNLNAEWSLNVAVLPGGLKDALLKDQLSDGGQRVSRVCPAHRRRPGVVVFGTARSDFRARAWMYRKGRGSHCGRCQIQLHRADGSGWGKRGELVGRHQKGDL